MTDYERIKGGCVQRGELWEDPDFPAAQSSVFYHQTPPFHFEWKRPKTNFSLPPIYYDVWVEIGMPETGLDRGRPRRLRISARSSKLSNVINASGQRPSLQSAVEVLS